jgi:Mn-dependent DtxR family transcriptional regulator
MEPTALTASMEYYLEAIYHLGQEHQVARVKDIARRLKLHKSTVSGTLKYLVEVKVQGYHFSLRREEAATVTVELP